jgi:starvation-inducible DNA-binding protein
MDKKLIEDLTVYLANNFSLYYMASACHWNVIGPDFPQLHMLFEKIYSDVYDQIDIIAEKIRMVQGFVVSNPTELLKLSCINLECRPANSHEMVKILEKANCDIQIVIMNLFKTAEACNNQAIMNYCAERLDQHSKHAWMLRATGKCE